MVCNICFFTSGGQLSRQQPSSGPVRLNPNLCPVLPLSPTSKSHDEQRQLMSKPISVTPSDSDEKRSKALTASRQRTPQPRAPQNSNSSPELQPCRAQAVANTQACRRKMAESRFDILQNRRGRSDAGDGGEITSHKAPAGSGGFHPASQLSVMLDRSYPGRVCHKIVHPGPQAH